MAIHDYHFINHWRVEGAVEEVADIIAEPLEMPRWWPAWCLSAAQVEKGDESGVGRVVNIQAKGWMPYAIRWQLRVGESDRPRRYVVHVTGDLEGRGIWTFEQDGPFVNATLDWKVRAHFAVIRYLSFLLKPLFRNNHFWAMDRGEESLRLELARRHAATAEERARIPGPPPPTWPHRRQWEKNLRAGILDAGRPAEGAQVRDSAAAR
jgi:hypothetical protein